MIPHLLLQMDSILNSQNLSAVAGFSMLVMAYCYQIHHLPNKCKHIELTSVNYQFTRKCNYKCGFCFHTAKNSHVESLENAKKIIKTVRENGGKKINFAGGEPFLPEYHKHLGEMVKYSKLIGYESVSIISNGKHIKESWFVEYGQYLDMLGVSCDSTYEEINIRIGRGSGDHVTTVRAAAALCKKYSIMFKLNTVVNKYNWNTTDMIEFINEIKPNRWKIFQVLSLKDENSGENAKRNVDEFLITSEQFQTYINNHKMLVNNAEKVMKIEDNNTMQSSYILIDEYGRFLDCSTGGKVPTSSILGEGGIEQALKELSQSTGGGFDKDAFYRRDGVFEWTNPYNQNNACSTMPVIDIEDVQPLGCKQ